MGIDQRKHRGGRLPAIGRERDAPGVASGQALRKLRPRSAGIGGLVDAAFRTAANQLTDGAAALIGRRVQHIGILRIEREIVGAGVGADRQARLPRLAAVRGLEHAALAARREQRPLRGHVDDVRVARIDQQAADVLRRREAGTLPGRARVRRFVDPVAEVGAALTGVLTGREPDDVRVFRIDGHTTERERAPFFENRLEGDPAVRRLPQSAERAGDIPDAGILRVDLHVLNAAGRERGTDAAELQAFERAGGECRAVAALPRAGDGRDDG